MKKEECKQLSVESLKSNSYFWNLLSKGRFGIEKEHVRVDRNGHLALTPHPTSLGNKAEHPFITTDFSESQIEMITPPMDSVEEAYGFLKTLHNIVLEGLPEGEDLWLQSMPPILPSEDLIPLAQFDGNSNNKTAYREHLSKVYGKSRQMISGSHFNFSFCDDFFQYFIDQKQIDLPVEKVKGQIYLNLARNLMRHRWFLVALLGRSPRNHESLQLKSLGTQDLLEVCCEFGVSIRSSKIGYRNPHPLSTDYSCIEGYNNAIEDHVRSGKLVNRNELYLPIRIKGDEMGNVSHIEIRLLDLDPFDPIGLDVRSLKILHSFILYSLLSEDSGAFDCEEQRVADEMQNTAACCGFSFVDECARASCPESDMQQKASELLVKMRDALGCDLIEDLGFDDSLRWAESLVMDPQSHPAVRLIGEIERRGFINFHLDQQIASRKSLEGESFRFYGLEDMELSTQLLLRESVKRGVEFEILDRRENFVRLFRLGKEEFVMQATRTSLDNYSSVLLMENKLVTKKILNRVGIRTPVGRCFNSKREAEGHWFEVQGKAVVVKPKSTNFGLGISILKENLDTCSFKKAIQMAFEHDKDILIEEFIRGKEYRFFLIGEQVVGVLHRVPANVLGDGCSSIEELVNKKNENPLRGEGYRTPLEKIKLGEAESMFLNTQELDFDSIPANAEIVYLRENSNISTGGDSVDYTEKVHRSYFEIASKAAKALGVNITGLDMMIEDVLVPANNQNHAIIEMNFNPAIHIHCFPAQGVNRRIDQYLLNQLGFI